jgi:hypothetical protein
MAYKIKNKSQSEPKKVTRIEIRHNNTSKSLTLEHTDAKDLSDFLKDKMSTLKSNIDVQIPVTDSPVKYVMKCMVQVYEATTKSSKYKNNFKSFTCYGVDGGTVLESITKFLEES